MHLETSLNDRAPEGLNTLVGANEISESSRYVTGFKTEPLPVKWKADLGSWLKSTSSKSFSNVIFWSVNHLISDFFGYKGMYMECYNIK